MKKMPKLGICSYAYRWSIEGQGYKPQRLMTPLEFAQNAKNHGAEVIQMCDHLRLNMCTENEIYAIRTFCNSNNLNIETGASSSQPAYLYDFLKLSEKLGANIVRVIPSINRNHPQDNVMQQIDNVAAQLKEIGLEAHHRGITLALENHANIRMIELIYLVEKINRNNVGICLDTMNSVIFLENPLEVTKMAISHVISVHLKDFLIRFNRNGHRIEGVALGDGIVDFKRILSELLSKAPKLKSLHIELFIRRKSSQEKILSYENECISISIKRARSLIELARNNH